MAPPKVFHGARAVVSVGIKIVGIINSISYQVSYDTQDAYILGRLHPAEIGYTAQEPISGSMNGWKVVDNGAHAALGLPSLAQLLTADYTQISLTDRVTGKVIGKIQQVRLLGHSGSSAARQFSEIAVPFKAILFSDETVTNNDERPDRTDLP